MERGGQAGKEVGMGGDCRRRRQVPRQPLAETTTFTLLEPGGCTRAVMQVAEKCTGTCERESY